NIVLDALSEVALLLGLFSSACELRDLKIISIQAILEEDEAISPDTVPLLKLESLHLERLHFNFLELLLTSIAPGLYHLTLNPGEEICSNYPSNDDIISSEDICTLLEGMMVHKLILSVDELGFWETAKGLWSTLKSIPGVKTLVLNFYDLDQDILKALKLPKPQSGASTHNKKFPKLDALEIYGAMFHTQLSNLNAGFKGLLAYHPIRRMVIGGNVQVEDSGETDYIALNEED
ncbi:hypothetical protein FRC11_001015, partial [Ceratobasidium sp. 423]